MNSQAYRDFCVAIKDSEDLMDHFNKLNSKPPPPEIEVLKRASLVMALAALEAYFEDIVNETAQNICGTQNAEEKLISFYRKALEVDLKTFHSPSVERVKQLFKKYLDIEVTEGWKWDNYRPEKAIEKLNILVKKRGEIAHRSLRPKDNQSEHAVKTDEMRKNINFIKKIVEATDKYLKSKINIS